MTNRLFILVVALLIAGSMIDYTYGDTGALGGDSGKDINGLVGDGNAPALSEDGAWVAYYDNNYQIWKVDVNGNGRMQLTSGHLDLHPSWSPDGKKIAFRRSTVIEGSSFHDIWIMNSDGTNQMPLTDALGSKGAYDRPAWSPDGTKIAIEAAVDGMMSEIYIIDVKTKELFNLTAGNSRDNNRINHQTPAWLADGERITLLRNDDFVVMSTVGGELK